MGAIQDAVDAAYADGESAAFRRLEAMVRASRACWISIDWMPGKNEVPDQKGTRIGDYTIEDNEGTLLGSAPSLREAVEMAEAALVPEKPAPSGIRIVKEKDGG